MSKPEGQNDGVSKATPSRGRRQGVIAPHPFPDQEARRQMSEQATRHPTKRRRNRDYKLMPNGSLATD